MIADTEKRWRQEYEGPRRHQTFRQSLMICQVAQMLGGWFSLSEFLDVFHKEVGQLKYRTAHRYMVTLELAGVLELRVGKQPFGPKQYEYRWLGWPEPLKQPRARYRA